MWAYYINCMFVKLIILVADNEWEAKIDPKKRLVCNFSMSETGEKKIISSQLEIIYFGLRNL